MSCSEPQHALKKMVLAPVKATAQEKRTTGISVVLKSDRVNSMRVQAWYPMSCMMLLMVETRGMASK